MTPLEFPIGQSGQHIIIDANVLEHFDNHRQLRWWQSEAGGHLYAQFEGNAIRLTRATGPQPSDLRSRFFFSFSKKRAQNEIDRHFAEGLEYVGDWHTHPEDKPTPSGIDLSTMKSRFHSSQHRLRAFLFIIVGRISFPEGLAVMLHDGKECISLAPLCLSDDSNVASRNSAA